MTEGNKQTLPTVLIVHGWNDDLHTGWLNWLTGELRRRDYQVYAPHLRIQDRPLLEKWYQQLRPPAEDLGDKSVIIAHSLGCFVVLRLLESMRLLNPVHRIIFISGFFDAPSQSVSEFFTPEPDWQKIRTQAREFICIASSDDTIVAVDRTRRLADKLGASIITLEGRGHFLGSKGMKIFPEILELIV